jgi:hypothetical protein
LVSHGQLDAIATGGGDPRFDLAQETPPYPDTAQLGRHPHRNDVKHAPIPLVAVGSDETDRLAPTHRQQSRRLLPRRIPRGPTDPFVLGERRLARIRRCERRRISRKRPEAHSFDNRPFRDRDSPDHGALLHHASVGASESDGSPRHGSRWRLTPPPGARARRCRADPRVRGESAGHGRVRVLGGGHPAPSRWLHS